jgi:phosphate transport system protein
MTHLEERLERDLDKIHDRVAKMGAQVQEAVKNAVHSLETGNTRLAYAVVLNDNPINRCMREIDKICQRFFAVHIPSGGHLRLLYSVIRVNIELERIGDYAVTIAREGAQLSRPPEGALGRELDRIASESMLMLRQAIKAFTELNAEMAKSTMVMANELEYNLDSVYAEMVVNDDQEKLKELLAVFVIFTQLKRVADQAKNLCEETVFAVTGEQKRTKRFNILFIDEENSSLSQLAEVIARQNYPQSGRYRSAGRTPAAALNPAMNAFLEARGIDFSQARPSSLDQLTPHELSEQHVIVSLQGDVPSYLSQIPFHTSALEWDLGAAPEAGDEQQAWEALYRGIALQIKDLVELLHGEEAS